MENEETFSESLNNYLRKYWTHQDPGKMTVNDNIELFNNCSNLIDINKGFPDDSIHMLKGWSFHGALFNLLYTDQQILIYFKALNFDREDSRVWKLLGVKFYSLMMYEEAIKCLKIAVNIGVVSNTNATYELIGVCFAFLNNIKEAENWLKHSTRLDLAFIYNTYGSIINYANLAFKKSADLSGQHEIHELRKMLESIT
jgi:tetratricopeptide (TPR) repeat protein